MRHLNQKGRYCPTHYYVPPPPPPLHMDFQTFLGPFVRYYTALLILLHYLHYKEANTYTTVNIQSKYRVAVFWHHLVSAWSWSRLWDLNDYNEGVQSILLLILLIPANVNSYPHKHNLIRERESHSQVRYSYWDWRIMYFAIVKPKSSRKNAPKHQNSLIAPPMHRLIWSLPRELMIKFIVANELR